MESSVEPWMRETPPAGTGGVAWLDLDSRMSQWRSRFDDVIAEMTSPVVWAGQASEALNRKATGTEPEYRTVRAQNAEIGHSLEAFVSKWRQLSHSVDVEESALRAAKQHLTDLGTPMLNDESHRQELSEARRRVEQHREELRQLTLQLERADQDASSVVQSSAGTINSCVEHGNRAAWLGSIMPPEAIVALSLTNMRSISDGELMRAAAAGLLLGSDTEDLQRRAAGVVLDQLAGVKGGADVSVSPECLAVMRVMSDSPAFLKVFFEGFHAVQMQKLAGHSLQQPNSALQDTLYKMLNGATVEGLISEDYVIDFIFASTGDETTTSRHINKFIAGFPAGSEFVGVQGEAVLRAYYTASTTGDHGYPIDGWEVVNTFLTALTPRQALDIFSKGLEKGGNDVDDKTRGKDDFLEFYIDSDRSIEVPPQLIASVLKNAIIFDESAGVETSKKTAWLFGAYVHSYAKHGVPEQSKQIVFETMMSRSRDLFENMSVDNVGGESDSDSAREPIYQISASSLYKDVFSNQNYTASVDLGAVNVVLVEVLDSDERVADYGREMQQVITQVLVANGVEQSATYNAAKIATGVAHCNALVSRSQVDNPAAQLEASHRILKPALWFASDVPIPLVPMGGITSVVESSIDEGYEKEVEYLRENKKLDDVADLKKFRETLIEVEASRNSQDPLFQDYIQARQAYVDALDDPGKSATQARNELFKVTQYLTKSPDFKRRYFYLYGDINDDWADGVEAANRTTQRQRS